MDAATPVGAPRQEPDLTVLVVDDERPARRKLLRLLESAPGVSSVLEAPSGRLALEVIEELEPDVVFLDVRMPGMDGFQLLEALGPEALPHVVFVTAHDEHALRAVEVQAVDYLLKPVDHALRAFEVQAVDYLLKPVDEERFRAALERARRAVSLRRSAEGSREDVERVLSAFRRAVGREAPARLLVESGPGRKVLLEVAGIERIEASRNDVLLHARGRKYRLRSTLNELEEKLDPDRFLRINRSEIVNLDRVVDLEPLEHGDFRVRLENGEVRRMSRRYRERMERFR